MLSDKITGSVAEYSFLSGGRRRLTNRPWTSFTDNLWSMFILNKLYIPSADAEYMKEQPIWRVVRFLFVLHFAYKQRKKIIVPQIHFVATWPFPDSASSNGQYLGWGRSRASEDEEKMKMDTGITRYDKGVSMQAVCYLSVDWGGYRSDDFDRNLYLATFDISKENDDSEVALGMDFEIAKSIVRDSRPIRFRCGNGITVLDLE